MINRLLLTILGAALVALTAAAPASAAIPIYSNDLASVNARSQLAKSQGEDCRRGGTKVALRIRLGARSGACAYRLPVVGRDLDLVATGRLLSGTPRKLRARAYVAVGVRAGDGGSLRALVFPAQKKLQVIQESPETQTRYLAIVKRAQAIRGVNQANRIFLRVVNTTDPGVCRVVVRVNGRRLAVLDVKRCAQLTGRDTIIEAGSTRGGDGVTASFARLRVSVPNPFAD